MAARTMAAPRAVARGNSLIEVMAAIAVMLVGGAGVVGLNKMGLRLDGDGRRITRATAIAEELAAQIQMWPYTDLRLSNGNTGNDDDIGDVGFALEQPTFTAASTPDHSDADLGAGWNGTPTPEIAAGGFERYWNVSFNDPENPGRLLDQNRNGVADGMRIAVVVRYRTDVGWRRIVVFTTKVSDQRTR